jgi:acyl carrier protein phosphodiesterase
MNWLAHLFLSEPDIDFQLGNLLADLVRGDTRAAMSAGFQRGARCHHAIDAFTDAHPVVRRSRSRVRAEYRRFSGVLVDVFYDHCLATSWHAYSLIPLRDFTRAFYTAASAHASTLPQPAVLTLERIVRYDALGSYVKIEGISQALRGISRRLQRRWQRDFKLEGGVADFIEQRADFTADFAEFFPELRAHVRSLSLH